MIAKRLQSLQIPAPIMVDLIDDEADKAYGASPERLVILQGGKVAYEGERGPEYYKPEVVRDWLQAWKENIINNNEFKQF